MPESQIEGQAARGGTDSEREVRYAASRRRFMQLVGVAGGTAALSTLAAACGSGAEGGGAAEESTGSPEPKNDLEIVNYALFLEYLEEDFYKQVIESDKITEPRIARLMRSIRQNESEHVDALAGVAKQLGGTPVARPKTNFGAVITAGEEKILDVAAVVENLGAAAYLGQAPRIQNLQLLATAGTIATVEARHAAALNELAGNGFQGDDRLKGKIPDGPFGRPMTREEVLDEAGFFLKT
ncbi:MAG: ferritin-like domain-containing protein [Thermoleophilaceae bacterium]|jgi:rubrerythrin|nr:ferritin-like domain-containing protein [Thermoleophilaceae bacterium]